jgi:hypothetical protein
VRCLPAMGQNKDAAQEDAKLPNKLLAGMP